MAKRSSGIYLAASLLFMLLLSVTAEKCESNTISLNGEWELGAGNKPGEYKWKVPVPGLVDLAKPKLDWEKHPWFYYRRTFNVSKDQYKKYPRAWLKIDGAFYGATVWVNGQKVGASYRSFAPIEFEIKKFLKKEENEIIIRVGRYESIPRDKFFIGYDSEKKSYIPGLWGDVGISFSQDQRVRNILVMPEPEKEQALAKIFIQNLSGQAKKIKAVGTVAGNDGAVMGESESDWVELAPNSEKQVLLTVPVPKPRLWSPEDPYQYVFQAGIFDEKGGKKQITEQEFKDMEKECQDQKKTEPEKSKCLADVQEKRKKPYSWDFFEDKVVLFGMRKFEIKNGNFYLNGKHVRLFGSNIAFQRWLSDPERKALAWDEDFIKKVLVDIPKAHNMVFFRNHVGPLYSRWYQIADENGILLQDEYFLWGYTKKGQGPKLKPELCWDEYRAWIEENWNHPSIIIWDLENEASDEFIKFINKEIAPRVRELDPSRPIEPFDFVEDHPYQWSLNGVVNTKQLGSKTVRTSRPFAELSRADTPIVVNEFPWFWLDSMGRPTLLTKLVLSRWLGPGAEDLPPDKLLSYQASLTRDLVEWYRRMDLDAVQPFVYLSNGQGVTAHYFLGPLDQLNPKLVVKELKDAFKPRSVSLELFDRHFYAGEKRKLKVYVFNDDPDQELNAKIFARIKYEDKTEWEEQASVKLAPAEHKVLEFVYSFPADTGIYQAQAVMLDSERKEISTSSKPAYVYQDPKLPAEIKYKKICALDPAGEASGYLEQKQAILTRLNFKDQVPDDCQALVVAPGAVADPQYKNFKFKLNNYLFKGGGVVIWEPELERDPEKYIQVIDPGAGSPMFYLNPSLFLGADLPGKDSAIWPTEKGAQSRVFEDIENEELYFMNGGVGEEMVSELIAYPLLPAKVLARSSVRLLKPVIFEYRVGKGRLLVSRVQVRGRLLGEEQKDLWSRRPDPVAQKIFMNTLVEVFEKGEKQK